MAQQTRFDASLDDLNSFPPTVTEHATHRDVIVLETIDDDADTNIIVEK